MHPRKNVARAERRRCPPHARTERCSRSNVGVELGQLAVLAVAYPLVRGLAARTRGFAPRAVPALSVCTALAGLVWFIERV
jgi:hypothetical protein